MYNLINKSINKIIWKKWVTKPFSLISNGVIMFKDELKNWKWAAISVYHYIYIYKKQILQFRSHSFYSTTETSKGISQSVHKSCVLTSVRIRRKHTLPPLRLISWAFGGRQSGMDPTEHIIAEKELEWMYFYWVNVCSFAYLRGTEQSDEWEM